MKVPWFRVDCDFAVYGLWGERGTAYRLKSLGLSLALALRAWQLHYDEAERVMSGNAFTHEAHSSHWPSSRGAYAPRAARPKYRLCLRGALPRRLARRKIQMPSIIAPNDPLRTVTTKFSRHFTIRQSAMLSQ